MTLIERFIYKDKAEQHGGKVEPAGQASGCCGGGCNGDAYASDGSANPVITSDVITSDVITNDVSGPDAGRRAFLRGAVAAATVTLAPGVMLYTYGTDRAEARPLDEPATDKQRWGMLIDINKCDDGCTDCISACSKENGWEDTGHPATDAQWIRKVTIKSRKTGNQNKAGPARSFPVMCQHCAEPPCVDVCPTGASFKRADGIVLVDKHICIGCRYCMMACPYGARAFLHESVEDQKPYAPRGKGTVESCTLCVHRVDKDQKPACVEACAKAGHDAMIFGDLNDPNSEIAKRIAKYPTSQIRADLGVDPGVRYQNL